MPNNILTPQMITREAQRILHQKLKVIGRVNRQYDSRFAKSGAKIGQTLDIRLPARYTVRENSVTLAVQDSVERKVSLPVANRFGVDMSFTTQELTMNVDDFSRQFIKPAMADLAARIEQRFLEGVYKTINNVVGTPSTQISFRTAALAKARMSHMLAPDDDRMFYVNPNSQVEFNDAVKGLFHDGDKIEEQYREGKMGRTAGFDVYEHTLIPNHTVGPLGGTPLVNGANQGSNPLTANTWTETGSLVTDGWTAAAAARLNDGDTFTIAGVFEVHPETKQNLGFLKSFTVVGAVSSDAGGNATIPIRPAIIRSGAYQNVTNAPADNAALTITGTANTTMGQNLALHKDAFAFVTADLELPGDGKFEARETFDGISMRLIRKYDINNDTLPCRIDVLCGWTSIYPELATRVVHQL